MKQLVIAVTCLFLVGCASLSDKAWQIRHNPAFKNLSCGKRVAMMILDMRDSGIDDFYRVRGLYATEKFYPEFYLVKFEEGKYFYKHMWIEKDDEIIDPSINGRRDQYVEPSHWHIG